MASTIVLAAGELNYSHLPIGTNRSNAMVPVNGKPVIGWILDDLIAKGFDEPTVVVREENAHLVDFLRGAFAARARLEVVRVGVGSIVESLQAGLTASRNEGSVHIVCGDTLIPDPFDEEEDYVYVGPVRDAERWCIAVLDEAGHRVCDFQDKQKLPRGRYLALAGYYHLRDAPLLGECVAESVAREEQELSDVLRRYMAVHPLRARSAERWYDFGHLDNLIDAKRELLNTRYFNSIQISSVLNTLTKTSDRVRKLENELFWYLNLPAELQVLTPRIVGHSRSDSRFEIVQEYYGYPTLAELYLFSDMELDSWVEVVRHLLRIHRQFLRFPGELCRGDLEEMYLGKTNRRRQEAASQDADWGRLFDRSRVTVNDRELRNFGELEGRLGERVKELVDNAKISIVHGDFCFSNILFDIGNRIVRLIDPRGSFGGHRTIYGDPRYDMAKLRHSVCGYYDSIVGDLFTLEGEHDEFTLRIHTNPVQRELAAVFDELLVIEGYDPDEVQFLEGLLFVSMVPLHHGQRKQQLAMYLSGLERLNNVLVSN